MSCNGFNVIYVWICSGCLEKYIGETGVGKIRLRDRVRVYRKHIKQSQHQKLIAQEHIRIWERDSHILVSSHAIKWHKFTKSFNKKKVSKFQKDYNIKFNQLWQTKSMTHRFNVLMIAFKNTLTRDHISLFDFILWHRGNFHVWRHRKLPLFQVFLPLKLV